jgi:hypothetical protein
MRPLVASRPTSWTGIGLTVAGRKRAEQSSAAVHVADAVAAVLPAPAELACHCR